MFEKNYKIITKCVGLCQLKINISVLFTMLRVSAFLSIYDMRYYSFMKCFNFRLLFRFYRLLWPIRKLTFKT